MAPKRKRPEPPEASDASVKRIKRDDGGEARSVPSPVLPVSHPLLSLYFPRLLSLRHYLLEKLSSSSKARRRRLASYGIRDEPDANRADGRGSEGAISPPALSKQVAKLLDTALVAVQAPCTGGLPGRMKDWKKFMTERGGAHTEDWSSRASGSMQAELIDYAIWLLFFEIYPAAWRPPHILAHGHLRCPKPSEVDQTQTGDTGIPGVASRSPNSHVDYLRSPVWATVLNLLGDEGGHIMIQLIVDHTVFVAADGNQNNYYQLTGKPLCDLETLPMPCNTVAGGNITGSEPFDKPIALRPVNPKACHDLRSPAAVMFVRSRMFYARAALNAKGTVRFGLRHIHALNRYSDPSKHEHTVHIMMYIFPRQFGLHNVFTSILDSRETVQPLKDYTLREEEIAQKLSTRHLPDKSSPHDHSLKIPIRLRGELPLLVSKLQTLHNRCSYFELLKATCSLEVTKDDKIYKKKAKLLQGDCSITKPGQPRRPTKAKRSSHSQTQTHMGSHSSVVDTRRNKLAESPEEDPTSPSKEPAINFATPSFKVSAFVRRVISNIIPHGFWGTGDDQAHNERTLMNKIDRFVSLSRFETLSLHETLQGFKVKSISWLRPPSCSLKKNICQSDLKKRWELFGELIYYVFDSLVIPLIRTNFHVTESNLHRNRLFFFRHDVWRFLAEPALSSLKNSILEELDGEKAKKLLETRLLGFSQIRLLPKESGMRPIANLRRRPIKRVNGTVKLGRSINSILRPVQGMLNYEKTSYPAKLGSALFSVGDIYPLLKRFQNTLRKEQRLNPPLYFAKVDVKACFDTIPQQNVIELIERLTSEDDYRMDKHVEMKPPEGHQLDSTRWSNAKPPRKFLATARRSNDTATFVDRVNSEFSKCKKNVVFVDQVEQTYQSKKSLLYLLKQHIEHSVVKIGKKFYRQKAGIPQGSVLSTMLCSLFYADLEQKELGFLKPGESLLLRLIDDFLLISTSRDDAIRFLQVMHEGRPDYGVTVNQKKTLVNFEAVIRGEKVSRVADDQRFPYCGQAIDTRTLQVAKMNTQRDDVAVSDSLTIEYSRIPGKTFHRKMLNGFKLQMHAMFLDTDLNSTTTVLSNLYQNLLETAIKSYRYIKCLSTSKRVRPGPFIKTIQDLAELAFVLTQSKHKREKFAHYHCTIKRTQVMWMTYTAFHTILSRKQSRYPVILEWLMQSIASTRVRSMPERARLQAIADAANKSQVERRY